MDQQPAFTFQDLFTVVIGDVAKAIAQRDGETEQQEFARSQAATHMILGFQPRDVIEAMLAGHCVMLHELMTANVRTSLRGNPDPMRRGPRDNAVGLNKAFNDNLDRLQRYRQRPAEGCRDAAEAPALTTPVNDVPPPTAAAEPQPPAPVASRPNRAARRQAARAESRAAATASRAAGKSATVSSQTASPAGSAEARPALTAEAEIAACDVPTPQAIAACNANPRAMAALQSGDPAGFARAMGIKQPCDAFMTAANAKGNPFDASLSGPIAPVLKA